MGLSNVIEMVIKAKNQASTPLGQASSDLEKIAKSAQQAQQGLNKIDAFKKLKKEVEASGKAYKDAQARVSKLAKELRSSGDATGKLAKEFEAAKKQASNLKKEYQANAQALQKLRADLNASGVNTKKLASEQARLQQEFKKSAKELKQLAQLTKSRNFLGVRSFKDIQKEINATQKAFRDLKKSGKLSSAELAQAQEAAKKKTAELRKEMTSLNQTSGQLGEAVGTLAKALSALAVMALPIKEAADFQRAMAEVRAISGAVGEDFKAMEAEAKRLGSTTEYTSVQAAEGMKFLSMAGLGARESTAALASTLQLAQSGNLDLGKAADITTNILTGYGMKVEELAGVNDVLVQTFTHTNSTLEELGYAFAYVGPIAAGLGVDFKELAATLGVLHNAGIKGTMAGTALRGVLNTLFNPTKEEAKLLKELEERMGGASLKIRDSEGNFVGFANVVRQMQEANISAAESLNLMGMRAGPSFAAMISMGADAIEEYTRLNEEAEGRAKEIAKVMHDNVVGSFKDVQSAVSGLAIEVGSVFLPMLQKLLGWIAKQVSAMRDWVTEHPKLTKAVGGLAIGVASLTAALSALKIVTLATGAGFAKLSLLFPVASGKIGAFMTSVGAAGSALGAFFSVAAAGVAGWGLGRLLGGIEVSMDGVGYKIDELTQIGFAKMGSFFNWLTGASDETNRAVIAGIEAEARARTLEAEQAKLEKQQEIEFQQRVKAETAEVTKAIEETSKAWDKTKTALEQAKNNYDNLVASAGESLSAMSGIIEEQINGAWESVDSGPAVQALEQQLSEMERLYDGHGTERITQTIALENQISQARQTAIQQAAEASLAIVDQQHQRETALLEAQKQTEIGIIDATAKTAEEATARKAAAEDKFKEKALAINQATAEKKKQLYEQTRQALEKELDKSLEKEKSIADKIKAINDSVADSKKSAEEKIRELKRSTMSESQVYADKEKQVQELMQQAADAAATDTQKSIELYKEAMNVASTMGNEIKEGDRVLQQKETSVRKSVAWITEAEEGIKNAAAAQTSALETSLSATQANTDAIRDQISETDQGLESLKSQIGEGLKVQLSLEVGDFESDLASLTEKRELYIEAQTNFNEISGQLGELTQQKKELMETIEMEVKAKFDDKLTEKVRELYGTVQELSETETEVSIAVDDQASEPVEEIRTAVEDLREDHQVDVSADTAQAKQELATVEAKLEELDGKTYTSYHKVKSEMEASSALPTTEKIAQLKTAFDDLGKHIEQPRKATQKMTGDTGSGEVPLSSAINQIVRGYDSMKTKLERDKITGRVGFEGEQGTFQQSVNAVLASYQQLEAGVRNFSNGLDTYGADFATTMEESVDASRQMAESVIADGEAMIQTLSSSIEQLGDQIASIESEIGSVNDSTEEKLRKLNQNMMSDYEKWLDDKAQANKLYEQAKAEMEAGNYEKSKALMLQSQQLAESLAREVKDANGETIVYIEEATAIASELVKKSGDGAKEALQGQKTALEEQQTAAQAQLEQTEKMVDSMTAMLDTFTETMDGTMARFAEQIEAAMEKVKTAAETPITPEFDTDPAILALQELAEEAQRKAVEIQKHMAVLAQENNQYSRKLLREMSKELSSARNEWGKYKRAAERKIESQVDFTGTGSTKSPLMNKIAEISGGLGSMTDRFKNIQMQIDFSDTSGTPLINSLENQMAKVGEALSRPVLQDFGKSLGGGGSGSSGGSGGNLNTGGLKNMGKIDLSINGKGGSVIGKPDVLKWVKEAVMEEQRLGVR